MSCCSLCETLCETGFPFCWFFFRSMLPRQDQMAEVATLLADGPHLEAFHIHKSASNTASSVFPFLLVRIMCVQSISFFFSCCLHLLRFFLLQSLNFHHFHNNLLYIL